MGNLTTNFDYEDFFVSETAKENGINLLDFVTPEIERNVRCIVGPKVQQARDIVKHPLFVNSCFRPLVLNKLIPGSSKTSAHIQALGVDIDSRILNDEELFEKLVKHPTFMLDVDQLILERGCIHIGMRPKGQVPRRELKKMVKNGNKYEYVLIRIWQPVTNS